MQLAWYGRKIRKKATLGLGIMLSEPLCYGYHDYDRNIYLEHFSISYHLVHILATFWASIAYIKRISNLQTSAHSQN